MSYKTYRQAVNSLREFTPYMRDAHDIVKFWSNTYNAFRYARVLRVGR